jgi:hypothetical protein
MHIFDIGSTNEIFMNKAVDVAKLKFDCRADIIEPGDPAVLTNNLETTFETALMIVCHF